MTKNFVFNLRLGNEQVTQVVEMADTVTSDLVQKAYEVWCNQKLIGGWWPDKVEAQAKVLNLVSYEDKVQSEAEADG